MLVCLDDSWVVSALTVNKGGRRKEEEKRDLALRSRRQQGGVGEEEEEKQEATGGVGGGGGGRAAAGGQHWPQISSVHLVLGLSEGSCLVEGGGGVWHLSQH
jgi:hypothetical protein